MTTKFLAFVLAANFLVMAGCSEQKATKEDINNSEVAETEDSIYQGTKTINKDIFSQLTNKQQETINKIIDNIEDYDKDGVLPKKIDKDNFIVYNQRYDFIVEIGSDDNKVIVLLANDYEDKNKFEIDGIHMANSVLETNDLPTFDEVDFLTDEQKDKYNEAMDMISACDICPIEICDYIEDSETIEKTVKINGEDCTYTYMLCKSEKFTNYKEFENYVYSLFTKEFWKNIRYVDTRFVEQNGNLYCHDGARGSNITYCGNDKYELISKTENKIEFYVLNYYSGLHLYDGFKPEWAEVVKNKAVLEKIDGEWKFSELVLPW
ncbi:MAG: hypothetical protein RR048_01940 [Oscillospiraceae bacterium]